MADPHRLSEGAVVRASVLARLLGIRLLRLEADIALVPALPPGPVVADGTAAPSAEVGLDEAAELLRRARRTLAAAR